MIKQDYAMMGLSVDTQLVGMKAAMVGELSKEQHKELRLGS